MRQSTNQGAVSGAFKKKLKEVGKVVRHFEREDNRYLDELKDSVEKAKKAMRRVEVLDTLEIKSTIGNSRV